MFLKVKKSWRAYSLQSASNLHLQGIPYSIHLLTLLCVKGKELIDFFSLLPFLTIFRKMIPGERLPSKFILILILKHFQLNY
jgi:hypothetical protein